MRHIRVLHNLDSNGCRSSRLADRFIDSCSYTSVLDTIEDILRRTVDLLGSSPPSELLEHEAVAVTHYRAAICRDIGPGDHIEVDGTQWTMTTEGFQRLSQPQRGWSRADVTVLTSQTFTVAATPTESWHVTVGDKATTSHFRVFAGLPTRTAWTWSISCDEAGAVSWGDTRRLLGATRRWDLSAALDALLDVIAHPHRESDDISQQDREWYAYACMVTSGIVPLWTPQGEPSVAEAGTRH
ncbi:hypothetical protein [Kutzneria sp. 744]|uniref:hypothetical protein n=1 Tax=Kutzneria sp. (strain 744) TaxID=345341 RepID=UPI0003EEC273|nr:hypothetical protein [Kutzneria sp. 744]EWM19725.1 hypothetical protein KUTG_10029 [Kutzneria sp. 744]